MTTKRIIYTRPDGGVSIIVPAPSFIAGLMAEGKTEDEAVAIVHGKDVPADAVNPQTVEAASLPSDREFRNAWEKPGANITISLAKAKTTAQRFIAALVRQEIGFLQDRRTQAEIENDGTLVGQIDARLSDIQTNVVPQIRDGIIAASTVDVLKSVRQNYLDGRPQAVMDALGDG